MGTHVTVYETKNGKTRRVAQPGAVKKESSGKKPDGTKPAGRPAAAGEEQNV